MKAARIRGELRHRIVVVLEPPRQRLLRVVAERLGEVVGIGVVHEPAEEHHLGLLPPVRLQEFARCHLADVGRDAHLREVVLDLRRQVPRRDSPGRGPGRRQQVGGEAVPKARLLQQAPGLRRVVLERQGRIIAEQPLGDHPLQGRPVPGQQVPNDPVVVEGVLHGAARFRLAKRRHVLDVHAQVLHRQVGRLDDVKARIAPGRGDLSRREVPGDVGVPAPEHLPLQRVLHDVGPHDALDGRRRTEIVPRVRRELDLHLTLPCHEHIGAAAGRVIVQPRAPPVVVLRVRPDGLGVDDAGDRVGQDREERPRAERLGQRDHHGVRVGGLDRARDVAVIDPRLGDEPRRGVLGQVDDALERVEDVVRGQRVPAREHDPALQMEGVRPGILAHVPRLRDLGPGLGEVPAREGDEVGIHLEDGQGTARLIGELRIQRHGVGDVARDDDRLLRAITGRKASGHHPPRGDQHEREHTGHKAPHMPTSHSSPMVPGGFGGRWEGPCEGSPEAPLASHGQRRCAGGRA